MNVTNVLVAICSLMFFMIGADKFLMFLEPPCSMQDSIRAMVWNVLGVMQIVAGILIWMPQYRKYVAWFFVGFMSVFTVLHLVADTYDVGGAVFMALLLGLLAVNPSFIQSKKA